MRAALLRELPTGHLDIDDVDEPELTTGSVMVAVTACGICGTDLHIMEGISYRPELPFVLGHEPVGIVIATAPDVDPAVLGRRVVPSLFVGCRLCPPCSSGDERLCERGAAITGVLGHWGGFAQRMVLDMGQIVAVPECLSDVVAASLVDAGATAHNAARIAADARSGDASPVLIVGAGPLGLITAEILVSRGIEPTLVESNVVRREAIASSGLNVAGSLADLDDLYGVVIDCAGDTDLVADVLGRLRAQGLYVSVGYGVVPRFDFAIVTRRELSIRGVRSGARGDLQSVMELAAQGAIEMPRCDTWSLIDINSAIAALRSGQVAGKAVIQLG